MSVTTVKGSKEDQQRDIQTWAGNDGDLTKTTTWQAVGKREQVQG